MWGILKMELELYNVSWMIFFSKFEGNRIRSKARKLDNNEKPSKYFF